MKNISTLFLFILSMLSVLSLDAQQLAFPGAEGGGMYTTGGRGGVVYFVTSLADTETGNSTTREGTFRWCLNQSGTKTILFKVGGIIELTKRLDIPSNTTVAGQTAPGDGICLKNYSLHFSDNSSNIIVRYIRSRMGDEDATEDDAMWGRRSTDIIIDHCSFSWSTDECGSFYDNTNFTLQWCILSESLRVSVHEKGTHGYGGIWGGKTATFHHNLLAHHDSRNPRMCGSRYSDQADLELVDFRNNVIFNWGGNSGYAGMGGSYNFINNYYKAGTDTKHPSRIFEPYGDDGKYEQEKGIWGVFYVDGNYVTASSIVTKSNWIGIDPNEGNCDLPSGGVSDLKSDTEFEVPYVTTETAEEAYESVLIYAGASLVRDYTDTRVLEEVEEGLTPVRASNGTTYAGLIDTQEDVGGWDSYSYGSSEVLKDSDRDGMPDAWEEANGLDPSLASDRNTVGEDGYTMLEVYINSLIVDGFPVAVKSVNRDTDDAFSIFPNPASNEINLTFASTVNFNAYKIYNLAGKLALQGQLNSAIQNTLSVQQLDAGIYFMQVSGASGTEIKKFVIR